MLKGYDIGPAIEARRILMIETNLMRHCNLMVFEPTIEVVNSLASQEVGELHLLHSAAYSQKDYEGECVNVDIILPNKRVFYLGTIVDRKHALSSYKWYQDNYKDTPERISGLTQKGPFAIRREWHRRLIPVESPTLSQDILEAGVRRFLTAIDPVFKKTRVKWLKDTNQSIAEFLLLQIVKNARQGAKHQTTEEITRIFQKNISELDSPDA